MTERASRIIFLLSLNLLFFYFNTCRRLLVSTAPTFLSQKVISEDFYGFLSSTSSILFGICRFIAYSLLDWFPVDKYVMVLTIISICVCMVLSIIVKSLTTEFASQVLGTGFVLLFLSVGLPFPSSSIIIRRYFSGKERNFVWSLISISSCIGSIIAGTLCYFLSTPSEVFGFVARFGIACLVLFYSFYPTKTSSEEVEEKKSSVSISVELSKGKELLCLFLSFLAYFLIYLSRRIMSEWSSVYTMDLFALTEEASRSMYTTSNNIYEAASILSLLLFGIISYSFASTDLSFIMSVYTTFSLLGSILPQIASYMHWEWLHYLANLIAGFFISVPYASLDLVVMDLCHSIPVSKALSCTSLLSQVAAAIAGYPVYLFFSHVCSFHYTPVVLTCLLACACTCLWTIYFVKTLAKKEKRD